MKHYTILVAGGSGSRMQSDIPKQFIILKGIPILLHTIHKFIKIEENSIILVLPKEQISYWNELTATFPKEIQVELKQKVTIIEGGATRFQSVKNGLKSIQDATPDSLVLVHDGVRPLLSTNLIYRVLEEAKNTKAAAVAVPLKDTPRLVNNDGTNQSIPRETIQLMQTPQVFHYELMKQAFSQEEQATFTDCASVVEAWGHPISLVLGEYTNLKITTPEDLILASSFLSN